VSPPYDVISPGMWDELAARDPHNAVQLELPAREGLADDEGYARAARLLAEWRTAGVLRKDRQPAIYLYEQAFMLPGDGTQRIQRGFFARLKLEPLGGESGVRPHEATMRAPKEDRLRLLRATGTNTSAVMGLYRSAGRSAPLIEALTARPPDLEVRDDEGVRHRLWYAPVGTARADDGRATSNGGASDPVGELLAVAAHGPIVIADGHHRYETALRYRDERNRACEEDPPFAYVLAALYDADTEDLVILPTHRLVRGGPAGEALLDAARTLFDVELVDSSGELVRRMAEQDARRGRFGVYSGGRSAILRAIPERFESAGDPGAPDALRRLDVTLLATALERLDGTAQAATPEERIGYTKDSREAIAAVDDGRYTSAFLLDPTNVRDIEAVVDAGRLMPQKSTYFYPKVLTGLVFNPLEG
jgi:uncharacterized protein (DUF1015 family)